MVTTHAPDALKDTPEAVESVPGSSLSARTLALPAFRDLGPPDLIHLIKHHAHAQHPPVASFHHALGPDAGSPAAISAHLTGLGYSLPAGWKLAQATYCAFNAFDRKDVRVEVRIPGGVSAWAVDARGERMPLSPDDPAWEQVGVSAILRAILDDSEGEGAPPTICLKKVPPIPSPEDEKRFLASCAKLHSSAWQLGAPPLVQVSSSTQNWMAAALEKWFAEGSRWKAAAGFWNAVADSTPDAGTQADLRALAGHYLILGSEQVSGLNALHSSILTNPTSYPPLLHQSSFLLSKNKPDWALEVSKRAVQLAPSEYITWESLTESYLAKSDIDSALLTLNSCPMFTYTDRDSSLLRYPAPSRLTLPLKPESSKDPSILLLTSPSPSLYPSDLPLPSSSSSSSSIVSPTPPEIHPDLLRLPSHSLRGTFSKAYGMLVKIVRKVGWDELLRGRSRVFVMEEEYRAVRAKAEAGKGEGKGKGNETESESEVGPGTEKEGIEGGTADGEGEGEGEGDGGLGTPAPAKQEEEDKQGEKTEEEVFVNKRLCERWLDNLFMVLYEDLRLYTAFKTEMQHCRQQSLRPPQIAFRKTSPEWEIYGDLALRLHHPEEAREAYQLSLEQRFSSKALLRLVDMWSLEGMIVETLECAGRLAAAWEKGYGVPCMPSPISRALFTLVSKHGLDKVRNAAVGSKEWKSLQPYLEMAERFGVEGCDL